MNDYRGLSFWLDSVSEPLKPRPGLEGERQANVVIVGGGYTGLWAAYYLKKHQPDLDVCIVEAEIAGFGASGRNGGWCSAWLSGIEAWLDQEGTRESAIRLQRQMFDIVAETGRVCERERIDAHFEQAGAIEFAVNPAQVQRLREELDHSHALGFSDSDYRWVEGEDARQLLTAANIQAAVLMAHTAAVHPARLVRGLAETVERMGARILEHSPVTRIENRTAITPGGRITGDHLLIATEGYSDSIAGRQRKLVPVHSMMVATEPLGDAVIESMGLNHRYCFGSVHQLVTYGQLTADRRIAFGCRGGYRFGSKIHQFDGSEGDFNIVRDTLVTLFPQLRDVHFTHAWGGNMGVARSLRPSVNYDRTRNTGWAGGYFGNGVGASHLSGRCLADLVLGRATERLTTPWINPGEAERRWEPEPLRWIGITTARSLMHLADRQEARASRWADLTFKALNLIW